MDVLFKSVDPMALRDLYKRGRRLTPNPPGGATCCALSAKSQFAWTCTGAQRVVDSRVGSAQ